MYPMIGLHKPITLVHNTRGNQRRTLAQCNRIPIVQHSFSTIIIYNCLYRGYTYECMLICLYLCLSIYWLWLCISKVFNTGCYAFKSCLPLVFVIGLGLRWWGGIKNICINILVCTYILYIVKFCSTYTIPQHPKDHTKDNTQATNKRLYINSIHIVYICTYTIDILLMITIIK